MSRRAKIVCTLGPATSGSGMITQLVAAGLDVARLNMSHGDHDAHRAAYQAVRAASDASGRSVGVLVDLQGPKIRLGRFAGGPVTLAAGQEFTITGQDVPGDQNEVSVSYPALAGDVRPGTRLLVDDGRVVLEVTAVQGERVRTRVLVGGPVSDHKGLNLPGVRVSVPALTSKDADDLRWALALRADMIALSFVQGPDDAEPPRKIMDEMGVRLPLIAKVEKPQAVQRLEAIVEAADCVMVARGDLGIELEIEDVPLVQKRIIALAGRRARPVITATQMLDSMVGSSRPTRAEVTDVFNAILDGTDAVMLSQETAVGAHPVGAIEMMAAIAERAESVAPYEEWNEKRVDRDERDPAYTIAHNACAAVRQLNLAALVIPTLSGRSARLVSAHRPQVPIYALSPGKETVRRCSLMWGVEAARMRRHEVTEELIRDAARRVVELGWVKPGQRIGVTAGLPSGRPGTTSLFQVMEA
jgi:pyruvate kinase